MEIIENTSVQKRKKTRDDLLKDFKRIRDYSLEICRPLEVEDYVVQPIGDVSPPKWHLAHTTWFFEELILKKYCERYIRFNRHFPLLFNSYYKAAGDHWIQTERGHLSRPTVSEVFEYRKYVDEALIKFLKEYPEDNELDHYLEIGLNHEQQHQELLWMDIKFILGANPIKPKYSDSFKENYKPVDKDTWKEIQEGLYEIGHDDKSYSYDNEKPKHKFFIQSSSIANDYVTNADYLKFILNGGYDNPKYWLSEGWEFINTSNIKAPLFWNKMNDEWFEYKLDGVNPLNLDEPVKHISYFEADAFAKWKGFRLPTEAEAEVYLDNKQNDLWFWTQTQYNAYPGYKTFDGMLNEYNGKFMCNQFVLRGGCRFTPNGHYRKTYRNFYGPQKRWPFTGIKLAQS